MGLPSRTFSTVTDVERSLRFYETVFGGRILSRGDSSGAPGYIQIANTWLLVNPWLKYADIRCYADSMRLDPGRAKPVTMVIRCFSIATIALCLLANGETMAFDIEAHRGGRALFPENTLPSFANALSMGVNTLELDIGVTRDGAIIVSHERKLNPDLARNPDGGYVAAPGTPFIQLQLADVKKYDVGQIRPGSSYASAISGSARDTGNADSHPDRSLRSRAQVGRQCCAPQHRDQDRSQSSRRIARSATLCHAAA